MYLITRCEGCYVTSCTASLEPQIQMAKRVRTSDIKVGAVIRQASTGHRRIVVAIGTVSKDLGIYTQAVEYQDEHGPGTCLVSSLVHWANYKHPGTTDV